LSIKRFPKGLAAPGFFQKNVPPHYPESIRRFEVPRNAAPGATVYPILTEPEQLAYLANQGAIELHVPTSRASSLSFPDRLVFDLDPPSGAIALVRRAALLVRDALGEYGIPTVPIATGSKGYHVVAAITPSCDFEAIALATRQFGALLAEKHSAELSTAFRVVLRKKRVFIDWLRNRPNATVVAPYSLRARPRATVAVPIGWDEIDSVDPDSFTIDDASHLLERTDTLAALAESPCDPRPFVTAVGESFAQSGLVLEPFDRFRS
jgi:bifunctional non-homologous end joining protein LigD